MRRAGILGLAIVLLCMLTTSIWAAEKASAVPGGDYVIGPGDILDISVWKDEALTRQVAVLPDGKITFPLINEVVAGGKTVAQLKADLEKKLSRFAPGVDLSLLVSQVNSMLIYVIGRVNNPGRFVLNGNINALQALAMAGGFTEWAKKNKIKIFRETKDKTEVIPFSYDDIVKEKNIDSNIKLKRGDIIFVPY